VTARLRQRVSLEEKVQTPDDGGGFSEDWQSRATVFAAIEFAGGREIVSGGKIVSERMIKVRIRHRDDVTPAWWLIWQAQSFGIEWVQDPDGQRQWLELGCRENVPS
jgi:SPP1 family predicted phage head-tail adaptor